MDMFSLRGKVAVVTGAGTGIGQALANGLSQAGAGIVAAYRSHSPQKLQAQVARAGGACYPFACDIRHESEREALFAFARETCGRVDILVNNAGVNLRKPVDEMRPQDWDTIIDTNQKALYFLCQKAIGIFRQQKGGGKIINIASMLSFFGGYETSVYTASKHAVAGITKAMANEAAPYGINCNAIAPGWIATELGRPLMEDEARNKAIVERIPAARWGRPQDLVGAAVFLASAASDYVNGTVLAVDGGYRVR